MAIPAQRASAFIQNINTRFRDGIRLPANATLAASLQNTLQNQLFAGGVGSTNNNWAAPAGKPEEVVLGDWTQGRLSQGRKFSAVAIMCKVRPVDASTANATTLGDVQMAARGISMNWGPELGVSQKLGLIEDWPGFDPYQNSTLLAAAVVTTQSYFGFGVRDVTGVRRLVEPLIWVGQDNPSFINLKAVGAVASWVPSQDLEVMVELAGFYESVVANQ